MQFPTGEQLSVIIAFAPMSFAKFEKPDRYLTQKLSMPSKNAVASGCFELCKRHWSERNNQAERFASWKLRSLQCLLQSLKIRSLFDTRVHYYTYKTL